MEEKIHVHKTTHEKQDWKNCWGGERHNTSRGTNQGSENQRQKSKISTEEDRTLPNSITLKLR